MMSKLMNYRDVGSGPTILFGHSFLWDAQMWSLQIDKLKEHFRCVIPDLWSHGNSLPLDKDTYSIAELAEDHKRLLDHLKITECAVVGLSVGGMWATQLALQYPKIVKSLVLMDTYVGDEPKTTQQKYFGLLKMIEQAGKFAAPIIDQVAPLFFSPHTLSHNPQLVSQFKNHLAGIPEKNIPGIATLGYCIFSRQSLLDELRTIDIPTLVITGRDDIPRPPSEAKEMSSLIPNAEINIIEKAGHISNLEQPDTVTGLLKEFIEIT